MSTWSNAQTIAFIKAYRSKACIWNPQDPYHRDKNKVANAWCELSQEFKKSVRELKMKKEIVMTTFRKYLKRKKEFVRSGAGSEDDYQPPWFAYDIMESFLLPIYCNRYMDSGTSQTQSFQEYSNERDDEQMDNDTSYLEDTKPNISRPRPRSNHIRPRRRPVPNTEQQMVVALKKLTNVLGERLDNTTEREDDECDLYGKLIAKKLRALPMEDRQILMYQIDGLFIKRIVSNRHTPSPDPVFFVQQDD